MATTYFTHGKAALGAVLDDVHAATAAGKARVYTALTAANRHATDSANFDLLATNGAITAYITRNQPIAPGESFSFIEGGKYVLTEGWKLQVRASAAHIDVFCSGALKDV